MAKATRSFSKKPSFFKCKQVANDLCSKANHNLQIQLTESLLANQSLQETILSLKRNQQIMVSDNQKLQRINEDLDHFVYAVSHDLLGPLGNIQASLSGIKRKSDDSDFMFYLQIIDSSVKKFNNLIKNLVAIATVEVNMYELELVDLNDIITQVQQTLEQINPVKIVVISELAVSKILFSKKNLYDIVYNLISNSLKFKGSEPPVIYLTSKNSGDTTVLIVKDNGKGIPTKAIDKIFNIHGRWYNEISDNSIGLYLTKKLMNFSGGQIHVSSEENCGSQFTLTFRNNPQ